MTSLSEAFQKSVDQARARYGAPLPVPSQVDLGSREDPKSIDPVDLGEAIDTVDPTKLDALHQRYGAPAFRHAAASLPPAKLQRAAGHPAVGPRVSTSLRAAGAASRAIRKAMLESDFPDSTPTPGSVGSAVSDGSAKPPANQPGTYVAEAPPLEQPLGNGFDADGLQRVWALVETPTGAQEPDDEPVSRQWVYQEPMLGVNDKDGTAGGDDVIGPGDLVNFRGVGGSALQAVVTQVKQGQVIADINGATVQYPLTALTRSPGGSDRIPTPSPAIAGPVDVGSGQGGEGVHKNDPFYGGKDAVAVGADSVRPDIQNPDDGAPLTPYNDHLPTTDGLPPVEPASSSPVNGGPPTATELQLISRAVQRHGNQTTATALDALKAGDPDPAQVLSVQNLLKQLGFAAPGHRAQAQALIKKLDAYRA